MLAHTHGCVQAWPYVECSYSVWRGISMPQVLGCRVLACVWYRPLDGLLAGVTHRPGDYITLWAPSWTLEGFTTELQYILYHTITCKGNFRCMKRRLFCRQRTASAALCGAEHANKDMR